MLNRNVSYLNCNGFVDQENRVVKSKLFLYVVGSLPSRPEISAKVKEELKELNPRYSNYPALATPIGAVAQANDMQLSRDCLCEVRMGSPSVALPLCLFKQGQAAPGRQQPDAAGVRPEPDRGGHEWREVQSVRGQAGECVQDGGNGRGVHRFGEGVLLDGAGVEFVVADSACAGAFLD